MNGNSYFLAEFLFEPCCKDDTEGQLRFAIVGALVQNDEVHFEAGWYFLLAFGFCLLGGSMVPVFVVPHIQK